MKNSQEQNKLVFHAQKHIFLLLTVSPGILAMSALSTNRNLSGFYGFQIKNEKCSLINLGQTLLREFTDSLVYLHMLFARNHANQIKWPESYC